MSAEILNFNPPERKPKLELVEVSISSYAPHPDFIRACHILRELMDCETMSEAARRLMAGLMLDEINLAEAEEIRKLFAVEMGE